MNLASLYYATGNYVAAEQLCRDALELMRAAWGENHPNFVISLDTLATLYLSMGNYAEAESLFQQALETRRTVLGEKHPSVAQSQNNLAAIYVITGRATEALFKMEHSATIDKHMIGQIFSIGSESQRMAYLKTVQGNMNFFLSIILNLRLFGLEV